MLHCSAWLNLIQVSKRELLAVQTSKATLNRLLARVRRLTEVHSYRKPNTNIMQLMDQHQPGCCYAPTTCICLLQDTYITCTAANAYQAHSPNPASSMQPWCSLMHVARVIEISLFDRQSQKVLRLAMHNAYTMGLHCGSPGTGLRGHPRR